MSIATFDELKSAIQDWLKDDDVSARTEDFIRQAEEVHENGGETPEGAKIHPIRIRAMEKRATTTGDGTRYLPLPNNYLQMRRLRVTGDNTDLVQVTSPSQLLEFWVTALQPPRYFSVAQQLEFNSPHSSELEMYYYERITKLSSSNASNWLLLNAPNVYLYGSLIHAAPYIRDDQRLGMWGTLYFSAHKALLNADLAARRASAPVRSRVRGVTP